MRPCKEMGRSAYTLRSYTGVRGSSVRGSDVLSVARPCRSGDVALGGEYCRWRRTSYKDRRGRARGQSTFGRAALLPAPSQPTMLSSCSPERSGKPVYREVRTVRGTYQVNLSAARQGTGGQPRARSTSPPALRCKTCPWPSRSGPVRSIMERNTQTHVPVRPTIPGDEEHGEGGLAPLQAYVRESSETCVSRVRYGTLGNQAAWYA